MHVIQPKLDLLRDLLDEVHRYTFVLMSLDQPQQILAQNLENHANHGKRGCHWGLCVENGPEKR